VVSFQNHLGDEWLRVGPVKFFTDGCVSGSMVFTGKIGGEMHEFGKARDDFEYKLIETNQRGFRVCVHSIVNAATEAVLSSFKNAASKVQNH